MKNALKIFDSEYVHLLVEANIETKKVPIYLIFDHI